MCEAGIASDTKAEQDAKKPPVEVVNTPSLSDLMVGNARLEQMLQSQLISAQRGGFGRKSVFLGAGSASDTSTLLGGK